MSSIPVKEGESPRILSEGDTINTLPPKGKLRDQMTQEYDIVIIATPLTSDKNTIFFENFPEEFDIPGHYERIVCTMVNGRVKPSSLKIPKGVFIDEILTTSPRLAYNSIGKNYPVDPVDIEMEESYKGVWKIFSSHPLTKKQFDVLFRSINSTKVIDWLAYPHYKSKQELGSFVLHPGMFYINAIEKAGSAMEMSSIGGKNAALLAYKYWKKDENAGRKIIKEEL